MSHPTWVRGLKHTANTSDEDGRGSHPTWVRGLKPNLYGVLQAELVVAPYVGAWIETNTLISQRNS